MAANPLPPIPADDADRLEALRQYEILDTGAEPRYDRIVSLAAHACGAPIALFTLVDETRQWFKARVGLDIAETAREISFCTFAVADDEVLIVEDAEADPRFSENPLVEGEPHIRFYAGVPVHAHNGRPLGTLCVVDVVPRTLTTEQLEILEELAREVEAQLEIRRLHMAWSESVHERSILTDMVLHDVVGLIGSLGWFLNSVKGRLGGLESAVEHVTAVRKELMRLSQGISRAYAQASRGIPVRLESLAIDDWLRQAAVRSRAAVEHAGIGFESRIEVPPITVATDPILLGRMIRNLCDNAIRACSREATIRFIAEVDAEEDMLRLVIEDNGPGVPEEYRKRIFEPYFTGHNFDAAAGSGLGLSICRQCAGALGGSVSYEPCEPSGARFIVALPLRTPSKP